MNPNTPPTPIPPLLLTSLQTSHFPLPSPAFLHPILHPSTHLPPPLPALIATTKHRLLNTSLTTPHLLSPTTCPLPPNLSNPLVKETLLPSDIPVQVLDIEDTGRSKSDLLSELEYERLGERIKGREVIRLVDEDASTQFGDGTSGAGSTSTSTQATNSNSNSNSSSNQSENQSQYRVSNTLANSPGPFKLLLQDYTGETIYGYETRHMEKIGFPPKMHIGCKIMLKRGARVCRGMVWLEERNVVVLGGRLEGLDSLWREGWEKRVKGEVEKRGREDV